MAKKPKQRRKVQPPKKSRKVSPPRSRKPSKLTNGQAGAKEDMTAANRKIRDRKQAAVLKSLKHGSNRITAYGAAGVKKDLFYTWMKEEVFKGQVVEAETFSVNSVDNANYTQSLKPGGHMDRKIFYKRRGSIRDKVELTGPGGGPVQTAPSPLNDDELRGMTDDELERLAYGTADPDSPASK